MSDTKTELEAISAAQAAFADVQAAAAAFNAAVERAAATGVSVRAECDGWVRADGVESSRIVARCSYYHDPARFGAAENKEG